MLVAGGLKLVCDRDADTCRLYDLARDPRETVSVAEARPADVERLARRLATWQQSFATAELRPIPGEGGETAWPAAVQAALGGDAAQGPSLALIAGGADPLPIRRKAAELLYRLAVKLPAASWPEIAEGTDPELAAWIALAQAGTDPRMAASLAELAPRLSVRSPVARAVALHRGRGGDRLAARDLLLVAADATAPLDERVTGVEALGALGARSVVPDLALLLDDWQLMPHVAAALGRLGDRRAVKPLVKRLEVERMPERRTALTAALTALGHPHSRIGRKGPEAQ